MAEPSPGKLMVLPTHINSELALAATGPAPLPRSLSPPSLRPPPFNTRIGTVLRDKYRIEALLGAGGCGRVYRATHTRLQGTVAVKFLLTDKDDSEVRRARFDREAHLLARLSHPGIVAAHDYGEDAGELYLVMEYVTGRQLGLIMTEHREGMAFSRVIAIVDQVQEALAAAHSCGVIHRDIKPSNIMLYRDDAGTERLKLLDFGVAFIKGPESQPRLTLQGQVIGTVNYMAPEQCQGQSVGPAADIYSLGVVFYQMLTGRLPFSARTRAEIMRKHIHCAPPPIEPEVPARLAALALWALEKSPAVRPTAQQLRHALHQLMTDGDPSLRSASSFTPLLARSSELLPSIEELPVQEVRSKAPTIEAIVIQAGDTVSMPIVMLWGLTGARLEDLQIGLAMHSVHGIPWLSLDSPPAQHGGRVRAVVLPADQHTLERLRALRSQGGYRNTPVLVVDVSDPQLVLSLIRAGASDMALTRTDRESLCHQTLRLIRRMR